jgi:hypothetical protein
MAAKKKTAKAKSKSAARPAAKAAPRAAARKGKDPVSNFIAYAQANPAVAVVGIIVVVVALILLCK